MDKDMKEKLRQLVNSANSKIDLNKVRDDYRKDIEWNEFYNECEWDIIGNTFQEAIEKQGLNKEEVDK